MKLLVSDLEAGEQRLKDNLNPKTIAGLAALHDDGEVGFGHPLTVDLRAFRSRDMIAVQGRLNTRVNLSCARCLADYSEALDLTIELSYLQGDTAAEVDEEIELDASEAGLMRFEGNAIDLDEGLAEQVIMGLPFKPLCDSACKGLCGQCGANFNQGPCGCEPATSGSPFAVLKGLQGQGAPEA